MLSVRRADQSYRRTTEWLTQFTTSGPAFQISKADWDYERIARRNSYAASVDSADPPSSTGQTHRCWR